MLIIFLDATFSFSVFSASAAAVVLFFLIATFDSLFLDLCSTKIKRILSTHAHIQMHLTDANIRHICEQLIVLFLWRASNLHHNTKNRLCFSNWISFFFFSMTSIIFLCRDIVWGAVQIKIMNSTTIHRDLRTYMKKMREIWKYFHFDCFPFCIIYWRSVTFQPKEGQNGKIVCHSRAYHVIQTRLHILFTEWVCFHLVDGLLFINEHRTHLSCMFCILHFFDVVTCKIYIYAYINDSYNLL